MKNEYHKLLRQKGLGFLRDILPKQKIEEITRINYPPGRKRALTSVLFFGLLFFAQINKGISSVEELLYTGLGKILRAYHIKPPPIRKQSFSQRGRVLPSKIFQEIFAYLLKTAQEMGVGGKELFKDFYTVKVIDGSIISVAARLIGSIASQPTRRFKNEKSKKGKIKIKPIFNQTTGLPELINIDKCLSGELKGIKRLVNKALQKASAVILVFDLGYFSYEFFGWLMGKGVYFVSRIKENTCYEVLKKLGRNEWLVKLGITAKGQKPIVVRLVRVKEKKKWYYYITNLMDRKRIGVKEIRYLYRLRWQIEIFFKELKEVLNIKKIFFYNANGLKSQIYVALSVYITVKILMAQSARQNNVKEEGFSFKRTLTIIRVWCQHNSDRIFCSKPRRVVVEELLGQIYEFAFRKKKPLDKKNKSESLTIKEEKDIA